MFPSRVQSTGGGSSSQGTRRPPTHMEPQPPVWPSAPAPPAQQVSLDEQLKTIKTILKNNLEVIIQNYHEKKYWSVPDSVLDSIRRQCPDLAARYHSVFCPSQPAQGGPLNSFVAEQFCFLKIEEVCWWIKLQEQKEQMPPLQADVVLKFLTYVENGTFETYTCRLSVDSNGLSSGLTVDKQQQNYRSPFEAILDSDWAINRADQTIIRFCSQVLDEHLSSGLQKNVGYSVLASQLCTGTEYRGRHFFEALALKHRENNPTARRNESANAVLAQLNSDDSVEENLDYLPVNSELQKNALKKIITNTKRHLGTLLYLPTGVGKTFITLFAVCRLKKQDPNAKVLVVVPNNSTLKSWEDSIKKFNEAYRGFNLTYSLFQKKDHPNLRNDIQSNNKNLIIIEKSTLQDTLNRHLYPEKGIQLNEWIQPFVLSNRVILGNEEAWRHHLQSKGAPPALQEELIANLNREKLGMERRLQQYQQFVKRLDGMVLDESHLLLSTITDEDPSPTSLNNHLLDLSMRLLMEQQPKLVMALSATPWPNSIAAIQNHFRFLAPKFLASHFDLQKTLFTDWDEFKQSIRDISVTIFKGGEDWESRAATKSEALRKKATKIRDSFIQWIKTLFSECSVHTEEQEPFISRLEKGVPLIFDESDAFSKQRKAIQSVHDEKEVPGFHILPNICTQLIYPVSNVRQIDFDSVLSESLLLQKIQGYLNHHYSGLSGHSTAFFINRLKYVEFFAKFLTAYCKKKGLPIQVATYTGSDPIHKRDSLRRCFNDEVTYEDYRLFVKKKENLFQQAKPFLISKGDRFLINREKSAEIIRRKDENGLFQYLYKVLTTQFLIFSDCGSLGIHFEGNDLWVLSNSWSSDELKQIKGRVGRRGGVRDLKECSIYLPMSNLPYELSIIKWHLEKKILDVILTAEKGGNFLDFLILTQLVAEARKKKVYQIENPDQLAFMDPSQKALNVLDNQVIERYQSYLEAYRTLGTFTFKPMSLTAGTAQPLKFAAVSSSTNTKANSSPTLAPPTIITDFNDDQDALLDPIIQFSQKDVTIKEIGFDRLGQVDPNRSNTLLLMFPTRGTGPDLSPEHFFTTLFSSIEQLPQKNKLDQAIVFIGINHKTGKQNHYRDYLQKARQVCRQAPIPFVLYTYNVEWEPKADPFPVPLGLFRNHLLEKCRGVAAQLKNRFTFISLDGDTEFTTGSIKRALEITELDPSSAGTNGYDFPEGNWTALANSISMYAASQLIIKREDRRKYYGYPSEPMFFVGKDLFGRIVTNTHSLPFGAFDKEGAHFARYLFKTGYSQFLGPSKFTNKRPIVHYVPERFHVEMPEVQNDSFNLENLADFISRCCRSSQNYFRPFYVSYAIAFSDESKPNPIAQLSGRLYWGNLTKLLKLGPKRGLAFIELVSIYLKEGNTETFKSACTNSGAPHLDPFIERVFHDSSNACTVHQKQLVIQWAKALGEKLMERFGESLDGEEDHFILPEDYAERSIQLAREHDSRDKVPSFYRERTSRMENIKKMIAESQQLSTLVLGLSELIQQTEEGIVNRLSSTLYEQYPMTEEIIQTALLGMIAPKKKRTREDFEQAFF